MVEVWLPYGETEVCARIPARSFLGTIEPREKPGASNPRAEVERALREPLGTGPLREMAGPGKKVAVVVDDATSPAPTSLMVPPILDELGLAGVKDGDITVVFACGMGRPVGPAEMGEVLGEGVLGRVRAVSHDAGSGDLVDLGETSFGTRVYVNRMLAEADLRVLTGVVGLHPCAGYGGGRESVLPGVSGLRTIQRNGRMCLDPEARPGVLEGNRVHGEMVEALGLARVGFALNVVLNSRREVAEAFAGDPNRVFQEGVRLVDEVCKVPVGRRADIAVVSPGGNPLDLDLYRASVGVDHALNAVKRRGVVVLVAECPGGYGPEAFRDWAARYKDLGDMEKELRRRFAPEGLMAHRLRAASERTTIILVSALPDYYAVNTFNLRTARAVNDALRDAFEAAGRNAEVWAMPRGNVTLPILEASK